MLQSLLLSRLQNTIIKPELDFGRNSLKPKEGIIGRQSAVCIFIYPLHNEWTISLILRNSYKGVHSNQISLPGGKKEDSDKSLEETAFRECFEEIGAKPNTTIGQLPQLYIPPSNFFVTPFIGISDTTPDFKLDQREVKEHIQLPIETLNSLPITQSHITLPDTKNITVPSFIYRDQIIWGATGHILSCFRMLSRL